MQKPHNPFVICRAAAGSGKTFTLVKEYLKLAMAVPSAAVRADRAATERVLRRQFAGILAITFTNKAAGEMKSRVMEYLEQMAEYGVDAERSRMGRPLLEALNALPPYEGYPLDEGELRWMAEVVYSSILHQYSDLSVCTIDSFMHRIVRTFAHDLDRPVNFEVMIEQDELIQQAVAQLMSLVGTPGNEELTRVVRAFAESRMEDSKGYNIEGELTRLARQLFREGTDGYLSLLKGMEIGDFVALHGMLTAASRRFEQEATGCGQALMALLQREGVEEADCAGGRNGYYGFFRGLAAGNLRPLTASVANAFESGKLHSAKCAVDKQDVIGDLMDELYPLYEQARTMLGVADGRTPDEGSALRDYNTRQVLQKNLYSLALLGQLKAQLDLYCKENELVHLSEFNQLINSIVCDEPAPFIYERLGNRYHHFLIDEFQDTSVLQWHNLVPLLENGVSQRYESLVVGDGKQAIYRFRQGDVRQFVALPRVEGMPSFHGQTLAAEGNCSIVPLDTNYRTASSIVDFNNAFFTWLLKREPFASNTLAKQIYEGTPDADGHAELWQRLPSRGVPEGHVGVTFIDGADADAVSEEIRRTIVRLVTQQGYRQRDIMVLGRSNKDLDQVSTYLQSHGEELRIEVSSSESFFLVRSHAVMAVVSALRLLHDPGDRVAAADLLQRLFNLGLVASCHHDAFLEGGVVDVAQLLRDEHRGFDFRPDYLSALDVYDCCEELVRQLHLDGIDTAYVGSLLGRVAAFASRHHQGVAEFLEWFDENASADLGDTVHRQLSAASPEGVDAVRLLTIHKAKGLEAPVVICPFMPQTSHGYKLWVKLDGKTDVGGKLPVAFVELSREGSSQFDSVRDEERRLDEVDQLNVLYVALTRPQEQLFFVCPTPPKTSKDELSYPRLVKEFMDSEHPSLGDAGFRHVERKATASDRTEVALHRLSFAEWTTKVQVASTAEHALSPMQEESVRLGNLVHDMMAQVRHAGDVEAAVGKTAAEEQLDERQRQRLGEMARSLVTHADTERFFREGYEVKTECDLCDDEGICRPDRVVLTPDETWVVDFKTGQDVGEEHDRQVRRYCRAMTVMGYPNVSGWLIYLKPDIRVRPVM
ncbi:MAG: UvrD-helicase domain-containing protein [Bacteroidales bacterium]|nr:UvrD-helicase domain-containing protein [Bacteroidales bacterium]